MNITCERGREREIHVALTIVCFVFMNIVYTHMLVYFSFYLNNFLTALFQILFYQKKYLNISKHFPIKYSIYKYRFENRGNIHFQTNKA